MSGLLPNLHGNVHGIFQAAHSGLGEGDEHHAHNEQNIGGQEIFQRECDDE